MTLPAGWPPRPGTSVRSIRFYASDTATANFSDKAYLFIDGTAANPNTPLPYVAPGDENNVVTVPTMAGTGADAHDAIHDPAAGIAYPQPKAMIWSNGIRITVTNATALEFSFDGTNVHGKVQGNSSVLYYQRFEAGIAVRGNGATYIIEAW